MSNKYWWWKPFNMYFACLQKEAEITQQLFTQWKTKSKAQNQTINEAYFDKHCLLVDSTHLSLIFTKPLKWVVDSNLKHIKLQVAATKSKYSEAQVNVLLRDYMCHKMLNHDMKHVLEDLLQAFCMTWHQNYWSTEWQIQLDSWRSFNFTLANPLFGVSYLIFQLNNTLCIAR